MLYIEKVFLKILQNSHENNCVGVSFLITLQASGCPQPGVAYRSVAHKKSVFLGLKVEISVINTIVLFS